MSPHSLRWQITEPRLSLTLMLGTAWSLPWTLIMPGYWWWPSSRDAVDGMVELAVVPRSRLNSDSEKGY